VEAFEDIREDLGNSYTVTYYPAQNPNEGFRKIAIEIVSDPGYVDRILREGAERVAPIANSTVELVKQRMGLHTAS
jgi:hypothetical protein